MKLGVMGGTFDPIHKGHVRMAKAALLEAGLDQVLILPDGNPPRKQPVATPLQRLEMVKLALQSKGRIQASDMEIRRGDGHTADTLFKLKRVWKGAELYYIIGSDTFFWLHAWRTAKEVAKLCSLLVMMRETDRVEEVEREQQRLFETFGFKSRLLKARGLPISSSLVREALASGRDASVYLDAGVYEYIQRHKLYGYGAVKVP